MFAIFLSACTLSGVFAQSQQEIDFINWKIEADSMWKIDLMTRTASMEVGEDFSRSLDFLMMDAGYFFSDTLGGMFPISQVDSISKQNNRSRWKRRDITPQQKLKRSPPRDGKGYYYLARPIFSKDGNMAILYVDIIWAPMFGRGYIELYELKDDETWEMIAQVMTWMS